MRTSTRFRIPSCSARRRSGAVAVEGAIVLSVFLVVLMTMLDVSLAAARYNALSECVRRAGRMAIVRGERSPASRQFGPATWEGTAQDSHAVTSPLRPLLIAMPSDKVQIRMTWPDGGNKVGQRVRIELSYSQKPTVPVLLGTKPWTLTAATTMRIVH